MRLLGVQTSPWCPSSFSRNAANSASAALIAASRYLREGACDLILRVIGLSSLIYVPYDIWDDTIRRADLRSDARMLAEEIGGTTMIWGGLWFLLSLAVIAWCLSRGLGRDSNLHLGPRR